MSSRRHSAANHPSVPCCTWMASQISAANTAAAIGTTSHCKVASLRVLRPCDHCPLVVGACQAARRRLVMATRVVRSACNTFWVVGVVEGERVSTDEEIYLKHRDGLMRYATALVGPDGAPDVVSTVVTKLLGSGKQLVDLREPRVYLMRAVLNESLRYRDRNWRSPKTPGFDVQPVESRPEVMEAVLALPPRQRAAVYLVYWADLPSQEAAALMGCRPATVRRYLHQARKKLEEVLDER